MPSRDWHRERLKNQANIALSQIATSSLPPGLGKFEDEYLECMRQYYETLRLYRYDGKIESLNHKNRAAVFIDSNGQKKLLGENEIVAFLRYLKHHCKNEIVSQIIANWESVLIELQKDMEIYCKQGFEPPRIDYFRYFPRTFAKNAELALEA